MSDFSNSLISNPKKFLAYKFTLSFFILFKSTSFISCNFQIIEFSLYNCNLLIELDIC